MKMKTKTCVKCGNEVDVATRYCAKCGGSDFRQRAEVIRKGKPSRIHKIFYWDYDGQYVISKSKVAAIITFIIWFPLNLPFAPAAMFFVGLIFAFIVFLIGFALKTILPKPSQVVLNHNDYGLFTDLKHLFLYWQNKRTGEFVLAKTKVISLILFVLFTMFALTLPITTAFASVVFGLVLDTPAFLIGTAIHKFTNPNPVNPKREIPKQKEIPKPDKAPKTEPAVEEISEESVISGYGYYKDKINALSKEYSQKEAHTRDLIEKRFAPPQLTYTRFIGVVDKSTKMFNEQADSALTMIDLASEYSSKVENEIKSKINIMETIIDKMDDLTNELVLTMEKSDDNEVKSLFEDMSNLISSVNDYD